MDYNFICENLKRVVATDQFSANLMKIYHQIMEEHILEKVQPLALTIQRFGFYEFVCKHLFNLTLNPLQG